MATTIRFYVSYAQIAIFARGVSGPFNDWTPQHFDQGFSWRPSSVSFRTIAEDGLHHADVDVVDHLGPIHERALRVIDVPFDLSTGGSIEVGSISETVPLALPATLYLLRCEFLGCFDQDAARVRLLFAQRDIPRFAVVLADKDLRVRGELLTSAQSAR